jgi:hypothetical protein
MIHELKTWPEYFTKVRSREKTFEVRKNDRNFAIDDILELQEFSPNTGTYTGEYEVRRITYILDKQPFVPVGYIIMSIV